MIIGSHTIIQSTDADADRAFVRDVLGLAGVDSGGGWLIFALPPSELAIHPASKNDVHEHYLICDDVVAFVAQMEQHGATCSPISDQNWGRLTQVTLPSGGKLGVYEARHARPQPATAKRGAKKRVKASSSAPKQKHGSKKQKPAAKKQSTERATKPAKASKRRKISR